MFRKIWSCLIRGATVALPALAMSMVLCSSTQAAVLLNDTWFDADRTDTDPGNNAPDEIESPVFVSHAAGVTMASGSLTYDQTATTGSQRLATYFAPLGAPAELEVGDKLCTSIEFFPRTAIGSSTSRNFRVGLFRDPDDERVSADGFNDSGGGIWDNAEGYLTMFPLTTSGSPPQLFQNAKRVDTGSSDSLLGSTGVMIRDSGGGGAVQAALNTHYRIFIELHRVGNDEMDVTFQLWDISDPNDEMVLASHTSKDTGLGGTFGDTSDTHTNPSIYTKFDLLAFRFSAANGTADDLEFTRFRIEYKPIPEPATCTLLGLGALALLSMARRRGC